MQLFKISHTPWSAFTYPQGYVYPRLRTTGLEGHLLEGHGKSPLRVKKKKRKIPFVFSLEHVSQSWC